MLGGFILSNLSMYFFISSILTSEERNVSFSQLLCNASMLGWSLYLKIALRFRSAMFSVTKSNSIYLEIFRFLTEGHRQRGKKFPIFPGDKNFFPRIIGKLKMFTCE